MQASFDLLPVFKGIFGKLSDLQNISYLTSYSCHLMETSPCSLLLVFLLQLKIKKLTNNRSSCNLNIYLLRPFGANISIFRTDTRIVNPPIVLSAVAVSVKLICDLWCHVYVFWVIGSSMQIEKGSTENFSTKKKSKNLYELQ